MSSLLAAFSNSWMTLSISTIMGKALQTRIALVFFRMNGF
jgi:hypothetical protein